MAENKTQISILGCGWLGLPLAVSLLDDGFLVKGSTTSESKLSELEEKGIDSFLIVLSEKDIIGNVRDFLNDSEILIIDIPPKLRRIDKENFVSKISNLIPFIEKSSVKKVLFVSSTSVYADNNLVVTEETIAKPDSESGKQLLEVEAILQNNKYFKTTVLRFGGLIGLDRHPVKYMAGRNNIENPKAPVNLIAISDCIGIIKKIVNYRELAEGSSELVEGSSELVEAWGEIFNAVNPKHPTKKEYYTQKAIDFGLAIPNFDSNSKNDFKIVSSEKVIEILKYTFIENL
ncbi:SDR family NAD(P)-dependent oxidoreductase [Flavobacterium sp.]|uniref:SDR family NAD(P)-dependent oxidoreductase n=1 Tax=Flavobacterium sp. TaxID=239 RepID=UPI00286E1D13|nr:SDR family NAD(P)-dependent oxidoreductase [Flavobacterium sp.]